MQFIDELAASWFIQNLLFLSEMGNRHNCYTRYAFGRVILLIIFLLTCDVEFFGRKNFIETTPVLLMM